MVTGSLAICSWVTVPPLEAGAGAACDDDVGAVAGVAGGAACDVDLGADEDAAGATAV